MAQRVARIRTANDRAISTLADAKAAKEAIAASEGSLWDSLVPKLLEMTAEMRGELWEAEQAGLNAERRGSVVVISTKVYPILRFQVTCHRGIGIDGEMTEIYSAGSPDRFRKLNMVRLTVDPAMQPCYTDGEEYLPPLFLAERLMEEVAQFFERAARKPRPIQL